MCRHQAWCLTLHLARGTPRNSSSSCHVRASICCSFRREVHVAHAAAIARCHSMAGHLQVQGSWTWISKSRALQKPAVAQQACNCWTASAGVAAATQIQQVLCALCGYHDKPRAAAHLRRSRSALSQLYLYSCTPRTTPRHNCMMVQTSSTVAGCRAQTLACCMAQQHSSMQCCTQMIATAGAAG